MRCKETVAAKFTGDCKQFFGEPKRVGPSGVLSRERRTLEEPSGRPPQNDERCSGELGFILRPYYHASALSKPEIRLQRATNEDYCLPIVLEKPALFAH